MQLSLPDIIQRLSELSGSELNSLLLEVFDRKVRGISAPALLRLYRANRFVHPADSDMLGLLRLECETLQFLRDQYGFEPIECSPAAALGSCAVVGTVSQNKVVSATRNTEIVADVTNALALHIADLRSSEDFSTDKKTVLRFCTVHRHVRTQELTDPGHTPHFKVGCLVSGGRDTGGYGFESRNLLEQLLALEHLFRDLFECPEIRFKLIRREGYDSRNDLLDRIMEYLTIHAPHLVISTEDPYLPNNYYKGLQFKMIIGDGAQEMEIADGGFVDWTQQLLGNRKERLLISGFGLELLYKVKAGF